MSEATVNHIHEDDRLEAATFAYVGEGNVTATFQTVDGELVTVAMTTAALLRAIDLATSFLNANMSRVFRDLKLP
jgi:hypothetical protein